MSQTGERRESMRVAGTVRLPSSLRQLKTRLGNKQTSQHKMLLSFPAKANKENPRGSRTPRMRRPPHTPPRATRMSVLVGCACAAAHPGAPPAHRSRLLKNNTAEYWVLTTQKLIAQTCPRWPVSMRQSLAIAEQDWLTTQRGDPKAHTQEVVCEEQCIKLLHMSMSPRPSPRNGLQF